MAYLGRKGASAALTSADIPDGSISAVKVAADVATQAEIDLKANLASPTLTTPNLGTPSAVTLTNAVFPAGHVLQVVRKSVHSYVDSSGTTAAWENDTNDLHITVTAGNLVVATVCGGMFNAGSAVTGYWRFIRFSENSGAANQDIWTSTAVGSNHTSSATVYHYASTQTASCIAAHTGEMLVKRGSDNSGSPGNTAWSSDVNSYGPVNYHVMEIQQ